MPRTIALLIAGAFAALFPVAAYAQSCEIPVRPIGVVGPVMPFHFVAGQEYALLPGYGPGEYQHLDFSRMNPPTPSFCADGPCAGLAGAGGDLLRCTLEHGLGCCVESGGLVRVQTGASSGPVRQAVDALFDDYGDIRVEYPATQTGTFRDYMERGGNGSRILIVPLVEFVPPQCTGNNCWARTEGYATFFLKRRYDPGQRAFYGEFLNYLVCGGGRLNATAETGAVQPGDCGLGITLGGAAR
jgi:hypothetical protein